MPTPLPPLASLEGSGATPDSDTFRAAIGNVRKFLADLLGTSGDPVDARAALGVPIVAGNVLQMVLTAGSSGNTTSTSQVTISTPAAVTPRNAASKFLVECTFSSTVVSLTSYEDSSGAAYQLFEGAASIGNEILQKGNAADYDASIHLGTTHTMTLQAVVSNAALTARNFSLKLRSYTTVRPVFYSDMQWKFTEIKT